MVTSAVLSFLFCNLYGENYETFAHLAVFTLEMQRLDGGKKKEDCSDNLV